MWRRLIHDRNKGFLRMTTVWNRPGRNSVSCAVGLMLRRRNCLSVNNCWQGDVLLENLKNRDSGQGVKVYASELLPICRNGLIYMPSPRDQIKPALLQNWGEPSARSGFLPLLFLHAKRRWLYAFHADDTSANLD